MLRLVTGRAGSGKSTYCLDQIEQRAAAGQASVLVVPEQSSFAFERALTLRLGPRLSAYAGVRSFRSLCGDIFTECGGGALPRAGDAVRCALVRRAVLLLGDEIACFARHKNDVSFFALASSVIEELKNGGVTPDHLAAIAAEAPEPSSRKLGEIARIYAVYEALLETRYRDGAGEISDAAARCAGSRRFADATLFFDGFTGFTEPQFSLVGSLLCAAQDVVVTLCCDGVFSRETDTFATVRRAGRALLSLAKKRGVPAAEILHLAPQPRFETRGPAALEAFFATGKAPAETEGLYEIAAGDRYDELRQAADEIAFLVREQGYRYEDIVVVARDVEPYRAALSRTFGSFGIPYFSDIPGNMLYSPVTVFSQAAMELMVSLTTEGILKLLKTGLTALATDAVSELENYLFVWNIDRGAWFRPFTQHPGGFGAAQTEESAAALARVEQARKEILRWISPLLDAAKTRDGGAMASAVYETFKNCGGVGILEKTGGDEADEASAALEMLDALFTVVEGDSLTPAELRDLFALLAAATPRGDIPPTLEQVSVGGADRMRTDNPRAVFVLGLNEGVFPPDSFDTPLLTGAERDLLLAHDIQLTRSFENSAVMERLYLYRALSCARERVYLCSSARDLRGTAMMKSAAVAAFLENRAVPPPQTTFDPGRFVTGRETALIRYADALAAGDETVASSLAASDCGEVAQIALRCAADPVYHIADTTLPKQLLGGKTRLSATRVETFSKCRFRYFLEYTLRIKPLQKAEINPLEAGNFVHSVMENALRELGGALTGIGDARLREVVEAISARYVLEQLGEAAAETPRVRYLLERLKAQSLRLLQQLRREQEQSAFVPCDYELAIGEDGDIRPLTLALPSGETVEVVGKVDRVDIYKRGPQSYIRVVDYKTGTREFRLSDVYHGLSVQMLLYLFTIESNGAARYGSVIPAGVMYLPSDPPPPSEDPDDAERAARKAYRMDGLVLEDEGVIRAMERDLAGLYIPVEYTKSGKLKTDKLASLERLGAIRRHIESTVIEMAGALYAGDIDACPAVRDGRSMCDYCDYAAVCRRDRVPRERVLEKLKEADLFRAEGGGMHG